MGEGLWQDNQPHHLPVRQAHRLCALILALVDRLQAATYNLGHIGRAEQHHPNQCAQQIVKIHSCRQEQRQHHRCHEQHCDQRNAAPEFDKDRAKDADHRHV